MNKKNLILTSTVGMNREEWLAFRKPMTHVENFLTKQLKKPRNKWTYEELKTFFAGPSWKNFTFPCVGGSEIATMMGLNPYQSVIELYFEKIGAKEVHDFDNAAMFWGRELEEQIADKWQYWDGDPDRLIENFKAKRISRRCRRLNAYVQNKAFPWIFVSIDRLINKQRNGAETIDEGVNECKTISGYAANMWEAGIPPMYVVQLQTQITVLETTFGEMTILKDGRWFEVYPFDRNERISARILSRGKEFFDMCKAGIVQFILHSFARKQHLQQWHYSECERMAPEPDGSLAYEQYLSAKYQDKGGSILGNNLQLEMAKECKYYRRRINKLLALGRETSNRLKAALGESQKMSFMEEGSVTWTENGRGGRTFRINLRLPADYIPDAMKEDPNRAGEDPVLAAVGKVKVETKLIPTGPVKKKKKKRKSTKNK